MVLAAFVPRGLGPLAPTLKRKGASLTHSLRGHDQAAFHESTPGRAIARASRRTSWSKFGRVSKKPESSHRKDPHQKHCARLWLYVKEPPNPRIIRRRALEGKWYLSDEVAGGVCTFCQLNDKKDECSGLNHLLHTTGLRLCCGYGLAADGVVGGSCLRSSFADGEQVSPAQVQFRAGHALRVCCRPGIIAAEFHRVSRAQGAASRSVGENEMKARLRSRNG